MNDADRLSFSNVTISNFMPYFGAQSIDLTTAPERPLVIIHGENMRGKTSFFNALHWCLYGFAEDRLGYRIPTRELINTKASRSGDWVMSVRLDFTFGQIPYVLERKVQPKAGVDSPNYDSEFDTHLFLQKDKKHVSLASITGEIEQILPKDISRFFLFDGEMLGRYEILLSDRAKQSSEIKEAIEDVLGMPAVEYAISDVATAAREAARQQTSQARLQTQSKALAVRAEQLDQEGDAKEEDLNDLLEQMSEAQADVNRLDAELQATAGVEADAQRLRELGESLEAEKKREAELVTKRAEHAAVAWKDLLYDHLAPEVHRLEAEREASLVSVQRSAELAARARDLRAVAEGQPCPTCQQRPSSDDQARAANLVAEIESEIAQQAFDQDAYERLTVKLQRLRALAPAGVSAAIADVEREIRASRVKQSDLALRRDRLRRQLEGHDSDSIVQNRARHSAAQRRLFELEADVRDAKEELERTRANAAGVRDQIRPGSDPALKRLGRQVQLYRALGTLFQNGLDRLRDDLKVAVESDASNIFTNLTTDPSYTGLRINESYGLRILDSAGLEVSRRSAGAEQIVALSLIGALSRNAVRRGPVVMDTLLARLDHGHRERLIRYLPSLSHQVVILVFEAETVFYRDFLDDVRDRVAAEYDIAYVSSDESELRRRL